MKVRLLKNGKEYRAEYYKDLPKEVKDYNSEGFNNMDVFMYEENEAEFYNHYYELWTYMFDEEVEIIEE